MKQNVFARTLISSGVLTLSLNGMAMAAPCRAANPCAPRPGATRANPCAAKNPCAAAMSDRIDPERVLRPEHYRPYPGDDAERVAYGEKLFKDATLSSNGLSCNSCHQDYGAFQNSFAQPYPHFVQMTHDRSGVKSVHLDEMVQFCMVVPMAAKPLSWSGKELAALTAFTAKFQKGFKPVSNPCVAKNPCAAKKSCCRGQVLPPAAK